MLGQSVRRCLSTSAIRNSGLVKTPVQVHGVEGRYAGALYSAASKNKKLEVVETQLNDMKAIYDSDAKFKAFVLDPTLSKTSKKGAMQAILQKLGHDELSVNFFGVVAENGRLQKMDAIVKSFASIMAAHRGEIICTIISAKPLDADTSRQLETVLKSFVKPNETCLITKTVDPSLVGGLVINIGDKYVDMSLATKFRQFEDVISQAV